MRRKTELTEQPSERAGTGKLLRAYEMDHFPAGVTPRLFALRTLFKRYARKNQRSFPWRRERLSAFKLLVAELLLVQTDAESVARVWPILIRRYGSPKKIRNAPIATLLKLLRPLGLQKQRARALKAVSTSILTQFRGKVPSKPQDLLSIPYVGLYTAAALSSFKFGARVPIVDANTLRIFRRLTGLEFGHDIRRSNTAWSLAWQILPRTDVALHNYGMLDFAAQICTSRMPKCHVCPLRLQCDFATRRSKTETERHTVNRSQAALTRAGISAVRATTVRCVGTTEPSTLLVRPVTRTMSPSSRSHTVPCV